MLACCAVAAEFKGVRLLQICMERCLCVMGNFAPECTHAMHAAQHRASVIAAAQVANQHGCEEWQQFLMPCERRLDSSSCSFLKKGAWRGEGDKNTYQNECISCAHTHTATARAVQILAVRHSPRSASWQCRPWHHCAVAAAAVVLPVQLIEGWGEGLDDGIAIGRPASCSRKTCPLCRQSGHIVGS